ncbi:protein SRC2 [Quercus suber]|uniref:protein SRC2 n=1 Tax=Quercus suber TaxID=58331 RepID=UPI000CE24350|nr:protein SRC2-like [Quercus suber]
MSYRPLELVIQSAEGLKYVNHFKRMKPYAVVFIRDHNNILHSPERKTSVDSEGGSNPTWNFNVKFTINLAIAQENHLDLVVKLKSRRKTHSVRDKDIGEVRVLISELLKEFGDDDDAAEDEKHTSKNIVTSDGEAQGALAFSYKFGRTVDHPPTDPNVKQRPKRGANGLARQFVEGLGEGLGEGSGSGLMAAVGIPFSGPDDDNEQPDDDNEQPDDDNEDEYS